MTPEQEAYLVAFADAGLAAQVTQVKADADAEAIKAKVAELEVGLIPFRQPVLDAAAVRDKDLQVVYDGPWWALAQKQIAAVKPDEMVKALKLRDDLIAPVNDAFAAAMTKYQVALDAAEQQAAQDLADFKAKL